MKCRKSLEARFRNSRHAAPPRLSHAEEGVFEDENKELIRSESQASVAQLQLRSSFSSSWAVLPSAVWCPRTNAASSTRSTSGNLRLEHEPVFSSCSRVKRCAAVYSQVTPPIRCSRFREGATTGSTAISSRGSRRSSVAFSELRSSASHGGALPPPLEGEGRGKRARFSRGVRALEAAVSDVFPRLG